MSKGYICIAQNTPSCDYIRQAYALALSIKNTQSVHNRCSVCVFDPEDVPAKYHHAFDKIITIPWDDDAGHSEWKVENKWKYYYMTPYDETVCLDTDMIFTRDISHWWDYMANYDTLFTTNPNTYRREEITSDFYREVFSANALPNVYTAFFYFKKNEYSAAIFRLANLIFHNFETFTDTYLGRIKPSRLSGDVAYSMAIDILGISPKVTTNNTIPSFVHMKSHVQNVDNTLVSPDWIESFNSHMNQHGDIFVDNQRQHLPFHYSSPRWLTDDIVETLEHINNEHNK
jgi:hypothetical protein